MLFGTRLADGVVETAQDHLRHPYRFFISFEQLIGRQLLHLIRLYVIGYTAERGLQSIQSQMDIRVLGLFFQTITSVEDAFGKEQGLLQQAVLRDVVGVFLILTVHPIIVLLEYIGLEVLAEQNSSFDLGFQILFVKEIVLL